MIYQELTANFYIIVLMIHWSAVERFLWVPDVYVGRSPRTVYLLFVIFVRLTVTIHLVICLLASMKQRVNQGCLLASMKQRVNQTRLSTAVFWEHREPTEADLQTCSWSSVHSRFELVQFIFVWFSQFLSIEARLKYTVAVQ
jgi:hypothetical protein